MASDAFDREILQDAEKLRLRGQREIRDFVQEHRSAIRMLELASTAANAGGRALLDPEEFRFEQRLDDRGTVDGDERPSSAPAKLVELSGDELLAGAALASKRTRIANGKFKRFRRSCPEPSMGRGIVGD